MATRSVRPSRRLNVLDWLSILCFLGALGAVAFAACVFSPPSGAFLAGLDDGVGFGRGSYSFQDEGGWGNNWGPSGGTPVGKATSAGPLPVDLISGFGSAVEKHGQGKKGVDSGPGGWNGPADNGNSQGDRNKNY